MIRNFATSAENSKADSDVAKILRYAQDEQHDFSEEAWTAETLGEKKIGIQKVGATVKLCTVIDGTLYSVVLT